VFVYRNISALLNSFGFGIEGYAEAGLPEHTYISNIVANSYSSF